MRWCGPDGGGSGQSHARERRFGERSGSLRGMTTSVISTRTVRGQAYPNPMPEPAATSPLQEMQYMRNGGRSVNRDGVELKLDVGTGDLAIEPAAAGWITGSDFMAAVSAVHDALDAVRDKDIRSLAIRQTKQGALMFAPVFATATSTGSSYRGFEVDSETVVTPGDASIKALIGERGWIDLR